MKVIKRDGRVVDYDRSKVVTAIEKANDEVRKKEKASQEDIKVITEYIEELDKKRILVEDIQDIIEEKLMELKKYKLAKKYIVYRYTRALVRKSNTTDESILGLIRNTNKDIMNKKSNKNVVMASTQRDLIAGEVSKDLTWRMLLPEKISNAEKEGKIHFHNPDYFVQPIFNSCLINIKDMLDNGTVINGKLIESPESFQAACMVITQILATVSSNQYGGQSIDLKHLGKYLRKSKEKLYKEIKDEIKENAKEEIIEKIVDKRLKLELKTGVQIIQYQINTLMTINGQSPYVTLFLHLDLQDEYIEENAIIIEEILKQRYEGIKNSAGVYITPAFPKLIYVLDEFNCLKGGKYDYLTKLAIKCSAKRMYPDYISAKKMRENFEGNVFSPCGSRNFLAPWKDESGKYKFEGRFNQGIVSINLPQIGIVADGDEEKFWKEFDERLELCKEALMCRHYSLIGTISDVSPIHWKYGAIARLKAGEKIDKLLYGGYSSISLGYVGIYEVTKIMTGVSHTDPKGKKFAIKVMKHLNETVSKWKAENNIGFVLYGTPEESLCYKFARIDKETFGTIKDITDKGYYTNSYHVDAREKINVFDRLKLESEFQEISRGGAASYVEISDMKNNIEELEEIVKYIYDNIQYAEFYIKSDYCHVCGYLGEIKTNENEELECPQCGNKDYSKMNIIRRTGGYLEESF